MSPEGCLKIIRHTIAMAEMHGYTVLFNPDPESTDLADVNRNYNLNELSANIEVVKFTTAGVKQ